MLWGHQSRFRYLVEVDDFVYLDYVAFLVEMTTFNKPPLARSSLIKDLKNNTMTLEDLVMEDSLSMVMHLMTEISKTTKPVYIFGDINPDILIRLTTMTKNVFVSICIYDTESEHVLNQLKDVDVTLLTFDEYKEVQCNEKIIHNVLFN